MERTYTIPLRKEWSKTVRYKRAKKAVSAVKQFLVKHMKSDDVRLGKHLNKAIWARGIRNPPCRIRVTTSKDAEGVVRAELEGKAIQSPAAPTKPSVADKLKSTPKDTPKATPKDTPKATPKDTPKATPKEEKPVKDAVAPKAETKTDKPAAKPVEKKVEPAKEAKKE
jgi:large subunit ribosomal protein L31e